jgi:thiol-disulfide isomerase/thioredoxin
MYMKKFSLSILLLPLVLFMFLCSCDKVKPPYLKQVTVDTSSVKRVLCEDATATGCTYCPEGTCTIEKMEAQYPDNFIPIAYHSDLFGPGSDPMYNSACSDEFLNFFAALSLPDVVINRKKDANSNYPADFLSVSGEYATAMTTKDPVDMSIINISWTSSTRTLTYTVQAKVITEIEGNYGFNSILTEDSVHGKGPTWYQDNSYAGQGENAMCEFGSLPNPIPDSLIYYNHVARYVSDAWWTGEHGSIPDDNDVGAVLTKQYNVTIPATWNAAYINIVGMIINQSDSTIVNACMAEHVGK